MSALTPGRTRRSAPTDRVSTTSRGRRLALVGIVALFVVLASGYLIGTPRWNNPDEPAHYAYLRHLATTGQLPVIEAGDWDQALLGELTTRRFQPDDGAERLRYEAHQPPLYYLLMIPFYRAAERLGTNARVVSLRWVNLGLAALTLVVIYAAARVLLPADPRLAISAAGVAAFIPMHTAMSATISNDPLAELLASSVVLALLVGLRHGFGPRLLASIGLLVGLLLLSKVTVYAFAALAVAVVGLARLARRKAGEPMPLAAAARDVAVIVVVAALVSAWWFARNVQVYGPGDPFGLARHDQVVVGQPRPMPGVEAVVFFLYSTFRSFWAQFGWMAVVVDPRLYVLCLLLSGLVVWGLIDWWRDESDTLPLAERWGLAVLGAAFLVVLGQMVAYNLSFIQAQGRYLYPAMLPIAVAVGLGWGRGVRSNPWRVALAVYWIVATVGESLAWILTAAPAPLVLHPLAIGVAWLFARRPSWTATLWGQAWQTAGLVGTLALLSAASLLGFVVPFFEGR